MHVTDIHCAFDKIKQVKEWLSKEETKIDVVFISGDIANVPYEITYTAPKEVQQEHEQYLQRIVGEFVSVAEKVYFIPGNVSRIATQIGLS